VAGRDGAEQRGGDRLGLLQTVEDVKDDEGARRGKCSLPRCVGEQEPAHLRFLTQDVPAPPEVGADTLEDATVTAVLTDEQDGHSAGSCRDERGEHERRRVPELEKEAAADKRRTERDSTQDVLDPLRATVRRGRQQIRI